jgi:transcription elongation factor Elf1
MKKPYTDLSISEYEFNCAHCREVNHISFEDTLEEGKQLKNIQIVCESCGEISIGRITKFTHAII